MKQNKTDFNIAQQTPTKFPKLTENLHKLVQTKKFIAQLIFRIKLPRVLSQTCKVSQPARCFIYTMYELHVLLVKVSF